MSKRAILWAVVLIVAFVGGFGVGASLWEYDALDLTRFGGSSLLLVQRMGPMKWFSDLRNIKQPPEHAGAASESSLFHTSVS
jgi:hypothetical protein